METVGRGRDKSEGPSDWGVLASGYSNRVTERGREFRLGGTRERERYSARRIRILTGGIMANSCEARIEAAEGRKLRVWRKGIGSGL